MRLKVGLIGAGHMGRTHGRILAQDERVELAGVYDPDAGRAETLARELGTEPVTRREQLYERGCAAVYILSPNTRHTEPVLEALDRKVHVFSEKPMATSLADAARIRDAAEGAGVVYQVGMNRRWAPVYRAAKEAAAGATLANFKMNRGELQNPPWVGDTSLTGGFLYESSYHLLDLARWLLGEPDWVLAAAQSRVYPELDDFAVLLHFKSGVSATLTSSAHSTWVFPFERVELIGPHWSLVTEEMERVIHAPGLGAEVKVREFFPVPIAEKWGYALEDRSFVTAVLEGTDSPVPAGDAYRTVELVEACYQSARSGERIHPGR